MILLIVCLIPYVLSALTCSKTNKNTNCVVTNDVVQCKIGTCQYVVYGSFDSSKVTLNCHSSDMIWGRYTSCPIVTNGNCSFYGNNDWTKFVSVEVQDNSVVSFVNGLYHINANFIVYQNSFVKLLGSFSTSANIQINNYRESNKPIFICFNCTYLDLYKKINLKSWFRVSYSNDNCVDIFSLNSSYDKICNNNNDTKSMKQKDFPNKELGLYLLANNKLIRYCKTLDKNVECSITKYQYNNDVKSEHFSFDFPHCPCDSDDKSICSLTTKLERITFGINEINQTLNVRKDLIIENSEHIKTVNIENTSKLTIINSLITNISYGSNSIIFKTKITEETTIEFNSNKQLIQMTIEIGNNYSMNIQYNYYILLNTRSKDSRDYTLNISTSKYKQNNKMNTKGDNNDYQIIYYSTDEHINIETNNRILFITETEPFKIFNNCSCL